MRVLVCGYDGYIGWPLSMCLLESGHTVTGIDCFYRRKWVRERGIESIIPIPFSRRKIEMKKRKMKFHDLDIAHDYGYLEKAFKSFKPEVIVNLSQQPSAPYSMVDREHANFTMTNNIREFLNLMWLMTEYAPESQIITIGTMGEYGFPNIPIPEGFFQIEYEGMSDILPFPKQAGSVYHVSKAQCSQLAWMACRTWELRCTDVQEGVVYGTRTDHAQSRFDIGEHFGTMINRAVALTIMEEPVLVYGSGEQLRAYITLRDTVETIKLMVEKMVSDEDSIHGYRVINQFDECYSVNEVAETVVSVGEEFGLNGSAKHIENPRIEAEVHFYKPHNEKLYQLGWKPRKTLKEELRVMFKDLIPFKKQVLKYREKVMPKTRWRPEHLAIKKQNS